LAGVAQVQSDIDSGTAVFIVRDDLTGNNVSAIAISPELSLEDEGFHGLSLAVVPVGPDPTFKLGEVYAFPNPSRHGKKPTIHIEVGLADSVDVRIYDVSGQILHETTLTSPQVVDDGNGPQYAYEYTWNEDIPSGTYIFAMNAKKGSDGLKKISKLAVIR
jgi:hypothetical protein